MCNKFYTGANIFRFSSSFFGEISTESQQDHDHFQNNNASDFSLSPNLIELICGELIFAGNISANDDVTYFRGIQFCKFAQTLLFYLFVYMMEIFDRKSHSNSMQVFKINSLYFLRNSFVHHTYFLASGFYRRGGRGELRN